MFIIMVYTLPALELLKPYIYLSCISFVYFNIER